MDRSGKLIADVIHIHPDIMGGTPVFKGTRVHIKTLFDHVGRGIPLEVFLEDFPSVRKEQAYKVLALAREAVISSQFLANLPQTSTSL